MIQDCFFFQSGVLLKEIFADAPNFRFKGRPQHQELHLFPTLYDNCVCSFMSHNQLSEAVEQTSCQNMKYKDALLYGKLLHVLVNNKIRFQFRTSKE